MSDLTLAELETLALVRRQRNLKLIPPPQEHYRDLDRIADELIALARATLLRQARERELAGEITGEWLESVGFRLSTPFEGNGYTLQRHVHPSGLVLMTESYRRVWIEQVMCLREFTTRLQLANLVSCLLGREWPSGEGK